ncbi:venom serine carboxypeptidase [Ischnura elegans]|uniref:venom serine carboxypeptidase n=1 Tax=Ischnura elegans TaxID=197161 RepID=UPI001ED86F4B|nr:venom serine carboxypeptidase [Ischnura elegans]XP_046403577.1 venom serine carboxypeptidase [Ischnura elegans]XP_046403578.1 venom serine carboxypeptidase [Ischnura elegans]XP_046403580.1 venom serine carboxypeptidase [Ischnura elegans]
MWAPLLLCLIGVWDVSGFINVYPKLEQYPVYGDPGKPLYLTPLIESGDIKQAQKLSRVGALAGVSKISSYSGYLTVNKEYNSNLFFWFFPAMNNYETAPVVLWLQGGPGATSLFGLFTEHGPFYVDKKMYLKPRKYSWTKSHSVLYIDNPVGTGYSFTENDLGYSKNETEVGKNLYSALLQFFKLFPELQKNDFYVTGESYAGKYVPAISYTIHQENPKAALHINLKGLAIGNGLCDPEHMLKYSGYLYQLGLIDAHARDFFQAKEAEGVKYIQAKQFEDAFKIFDELLNGDLTPYPSYFYNATGFTFYYNFLHSHDDSKFGDLGKFVQKAEVRSAIHVGDRPFNGGTEVEQHLKLDVMQSVKPWVEALLDSGMYRIVFYNGQLDIIVAYPLTVSFLNSLNWNGAKAYMNASRQIWHVDGKIAGYSKVAGPMTEILVRNAGHMVPSDQPKWGLDLLNRFTANKPFTGAGNVL